MINSKKITIITLTLTGIAVIFTLIATFFTNKQSDNKTGTVYYGENHSITYTENDYRNNYSSFGVTKIALKQTTATSTSKAVTVDGGNVTINGGGIYIISGTLTDGSIIINSTDNGTVFLLLNGANITSSDFAALYIKQAEKTVITLAEGTQNTLCDGASYNSEKLENGKPTATLYSKDDLTINGSGTLSVTSLSNSGIKSNDSLKIINSTVNVTSKNKGICANDSIAVLSATLSINSESDSLKCKNEATDKGFVVLENSNVNIQTNADGIYASSDIYAKDVTANIICQGNQAKETHSSIPNRNSNHESASSSESSKPIKAGLGIKTENGSYMLTSFDDCIHSDKDITVNGGVFTLSTSDDGIHADNNLTLNPERIDIIKCYEGIEAAYIYINSGDISIVSSDDGINATGLNINNGFGAHNFDNTEKTSKDDIFLTVNGGHICIEPSGDGIDSNGSAEINGGTVEIYGPESNGDSSLDVGDGGYVLLINGGSLIAAGSAGMAEDASASSKQISLNFTFDSKYSAGSIVELKDSENSIVISGVCAKSFDRLYLSDEKIQNGYEYSLYINDNLVEKITVNGVINSFGEKNSFFGAERKRQ